MMNYKKIINNFTFIAEILFLLFGTNDLIKHTITLPVLLILPICALDVFINRKTMKTRLNIISAILSIIYSFIIVFGFQLEHTSDIEWTMQTFLTILELAMIFSLVIRKLLFIFSEFSNRKKDSVNILNTSKLFLPIYVILVSTSLLVFMALYPGIYGYDAGLQLLQFSNKSVDITNAFSLPFSFILYQAVYFGRNFFQSYVTGLAILSIIQILLTSYVTTKICIFSYKISKNKYIMYLAILIFSLFPLHHILEISSTQDTLFASMFLLLMMSTFEMLKSPEEFLKIKHKVIIYILEILFVCIMRNNGIYAILFALPFIILFSKTARFKILVIFLISISLFKVYTGPVMTMFDITKSNSFREMLSLPSQQIARVYTYKYKTLTANDLELINKAFLNPTDLKLYLDLPSVADQSKLNLNLKWIHNNKKEFLKLYLQIGIKSKKDYIEAFLLNNLGLWYPFKKYNDERMFHPYIEYNMLDAKKWNSKYIVITRNSKFPALEKQLNKFVYKVEWNKIPIISTIYTIGFQICIMFFSFASVIYNKKYNYIGIFALSFGLFFTFLLAPIALFRYAYPFFLLTPIFISLLFEKK